MALTKRDLASIELVVRQIIRESVPVIVRNEVDKALDVKLEAKFNEKLKNFITKDEFYKMADKILSELSDLRDEVTLSASHASVDDLQDRTSALEQIHPQGKHSFAPS